MRQTLLIAVALTTAPAVAADWSQWRGDKRDGHAETDIKTWPKTLKRQWRVELGEGHSSPVVVGDKVYIFSRQNDRETLRCLKLKDGDEVWAKDYAAPYTMHPAARGHGKGSKSTPTVADGRVFTFGISGILTAWDAKTGKRLWQKEFSKRFKATSPLYGAALSPLVHGDHVIVHVGGNNKGALTAFDVKTGDVKWKWEEDGPAYASPMLLKLGGVQQVVTQSQRAIIGVDPSSGRELWRQPFKTAYDQNSITPVAYGDLLIVSGVNVGTQAYRLRKTSTGWKLQQVWSEPSVSMYMSTPVVHGKLLFGLSHKKAGQFFCLSAEIGKVYWTSNGRAASNAALIATDNAILLQDTAGKVLVLEPTYRQMNVIARYQVARSATWAHPALVGRRLLVKDKTGLSCFAIE